MFQYYKLDTRCSASLSEPPNCRLLCCRLSYTDCFGWDTTTGGVGEGGEAGGGEVEYDIFKWLKKNYQL